MTRLRVLVSRCVGLARSRSRDARLAEEVRSHLDALTAAHRAAGLSPDEARLAARRDFGGIDQMTERHRDQSRLAWLDAVAHDTHLALRRLGAEPLFSAAVIVALAVGIGGAVSVVSAVTAISLADPPFRDPDTVMSLGTIDERGQRADLSWPEFQEVRDEAHAFDGLAAFSGNFVTIGRDERAPERVAGTFISAGTFRLLGVAPVRGRDLSDQDDRPGADSVALVGAAAAEALFGDGEVVGRVVAIDGVPTTIVGVMPEGTSFPLTSEVWRPLAHLPGLQAAGRNRRSLGVVGRLKASVGREAALDELAAITTRHLADTPAAEDRVAVRPTLDTFSVRFLGRSTDAVPLTLLVVAALVLLIGCATAATLLFARSAYRVDEITMRVALGASRRRLVTQLLAECAACAGVASVVGLVMTAFALQRFGAEVVGAGLPPWVRFTVSARVVSWAVGAGVLATVIGGLAPAWRLAGSALAGVPGRTRSTAGRPTQRWVQGLLSFNVALTIVLLSTAGYLLTGALALWRADRLVDPSGVVTARLGLSGPAYAEPSQRLALAERFVERLRARGDLLSATITSAPPFANAPPRRVALDGTPPDPRTDVSARVVAIDSEYFETLGISVLAGRAFASADGTPSSPVAIVNAAFSARFLGEAGLDRLIRVAPSGTEAPGGPALRVVGISPALRQSPRPEAEPVVYLPLATNTQATVFVMARARSGVATADILRDELRALDPTLPLYGWQSLERLSETSRWTVRTVGSIVVLLGSLALALSALGIYAVTAYAAGRRVKEAGIRLAIGASSADVTRMFVYGAWWPVCTGLAAGLAGAWLASQAVLSLVFQGASVGTPVAGVVAAMVAAVAAMAAFVPARRAASLDPVAALRHD